MLLQQEKSKRQARKSKIQIIGKFSFYCKLFFSNDKKALSSSLCQNQVCQDQKHGRMIKLENLELWVENQRHYMEAMTPDTPKRRRIRIGY